MIKKVVIIVKYSVLGYLIGEGFRNFFKNKKSTIASLIIMFATMFVFGIFFVIGENVNHVIAEIEAQQGMQVFINKNASKEQEKKADQESQLPIGIFSYSSSFLHSISVPSRNTTNNVPSPTSDRYYPNSTHP